jgi:hypothetical protein
MRHFKAGVALGIFAVASASVPASAHHAVQAVFDYNKHVQVTGAVTKVEFINPHSYISLDVKDTKGALQHWTFELPGPGSLKKSGMSRADRGGLKPGDEITIIGYGAKDNTNFGFLNTLKFPDGRSFVIDTRDPYGR